MDQLLSAEKICATLLSLNMKETAEVFRREFQKIHNLPQEEKSRALDVLNQIYTEINKKEGSNALPTRQFSLSAQPSGNNDKKIMDGFIEKLVNKFSFDTEIENDYNSSDQQIFKTLGENFIKNVENLSNKIDSNVDNNVCNNIDNTSENAFTASNAFNNLNTINNFAGNNNANNYVNAFNSNNDNQVEEDLPHFGQSAKKNFATSTSLNMNNSLDDMITGNDNTQTQNTNDFYTAPSNILINPNNLSKLNESNLEDSLFGEGKIDRARTSFSVNPNLENIIKSNVNNNLLQILNSRNSSNNPDQSSFFQNSQTVITNQVEESNLQHSDLDEYVDDDDPGFDLYECEQEYFKETCKKLAEQYDFPRRAMYKSKYQNYEVSKPSKVVNNLSTMKSVVSIDKNFEIIPEQNPINNNKDRLDNQSAFQMTTSCSLLPSTARFMESGNSYYPLQYNNVIYDSFNLKVIIDRERTGFEENKEFKVVVNSLIAGRYQVLEFLGSAAFSKAIKCLDILENRVVCLKIIENNKDYVDQSIDEIKLLRYINANGDPDEKNFLRVYDYFYHKEHLFIVTELLKDNLYDFYRYISEHNIENYFTLGRLQKVARQILVCLDYLHGLRLIHCDLKPENILMKSITDGVVKVIDFGSSCFVHDHLSTYVQSRSYRAPEVILGCQYDYKVDVWSLGCILAELYTGSVLFQNDSVQSLLARIMGIVGPFPDWMLDKGKLVSDFFTKERMIYLEINETVNQTGDVFSSLSKSHTSHKQKSKKMHIIIPKKTKLRKRLKTHDENFFDFMKSLLQVDPNLRLSAGEALQHPWMSTINY